VLTPYLINLLIKFNIVDNPGGEERRVHSEPVPRLGGVIIFLVVVSVTFSFYQDIGSRIYLIIGTLIIFMLGVLDDLLTIKWYYKFLFQSIAAVLLIISLYNHDINQVSILSINLPYIIAYPILFLLILSILNSFNLMDGLDGLVTGFSLLVASLTFLLSYYYSLTFITFLSAALVGAALGFLKFNGNPARIFLGDSGALTLGYLTTASVLYLSVSITSADPIKALIFDNQIDITFVLIVFAVPLADMIKVMLIRFNKGKHIFLPDRNHLHHVLYSKKIRHKTVVLLIHFISSLFILLSVYYVLGDKLLALILFVIMLAVLFFIEDIIEYTIRKENLLNYGKKYRVIPNALPTLYIKYLLPIVSLALLLLMIILTLIEFNTNASNLGYFLILIIPAFLYSSLNLKKNNYYAELLVLLNIIIFFVITGFNGFFYKLYHITEGLAININQIFILVLSGMIILFVLFKERIANLRTQFLGGTDLSIGVFIFFVYVAIQFIEFPNAYKISDTLLRSFLLFLFYKIIILTFKKLHFSLYYFSFLIALIAIGKSLF
jgi:UDP-GlcNAc:undecaprenyl-phosphate GlcNAc-1-phosphate transferase